jgi:hypothetical protein
MQFTVMTNLGALWRVRCVQGEGQQFLHFAARPVAGSGRRLLSTCSSRLPSHRHHQQLRPQVPHFTTYLLPQHHLHSSRLSTVLIRLLPPRQSLAPSTSQAPYGATAFTRVRAASVLTRPCCSSQRDRYTHPSSQSSPFVMTKSYCKPLTQVNCATESLMAAAHGRHRSWHSCICQPYTYHHLNTQTDANYEYIQPFLHSGPELGI